MRRILIVLMAMVLTLPLAAQKKTTATRQSKQRTTAKTPTKRKSQATPTRRKTKAKASASKNAKPTTIKGLRNERAAVQRRIRQQEQALRANKANVSKRLKDLMIINSEIGEKQKSIDGIQKDITALDDNIGILKSQLATLQSQLDDRRQRYIKSIRYMARHRSVQDKMMFVFSAQSFAQMYRRMRFVKEYAAYQKVQGDMLKVKQQQVNEKHKQLEEARGHKHQLLSRDVQARTELEGKQSEQQNIVKGLQRQQKTIQSIIDEQKKKNQVLNAQIDRLVAIEVAKAKARAEAEAKRKAAAAAAAKRKAEELARRKAAAEAEARENQRRIEEARKREQQLRAEAEARRGKGEAEERARQAMREATANREAAERKARADEARSRKEIAAAKREVSNAESMSSVDRMMSGGFEANKGRLPMPITGSYKVVSHFGQYAVEGLKGVTLDNKGINILGRPGAVARSVYDGEVSAVFGWEGSMFVMVRHGAYISVYCNLSSVSVSKGQKVSTRQALGNVGPDHILQFQLRRGTTKLNPESWLGR